MRPRHPLAEKLGDLTIDPAVVRDLEQSVDRTTLEVVRRYLSADCPIRHVLFTEPSASLAEVGAALMQGNEKLFVRLMESGMIRLGVVAPLPQHSKYAPYETQFSTLPRQAPYETQFSTLPRQAPCEALYLPPFYLVKRVR